MTFLKMNGKLRMTWRFKTKTYFIGKNAKYKHMGIKFNPMHTMFSDGSILSSGPNLELMMQ